MHRRTLTLAVVVACLALASPGFAKKPQGGQGKGKGDVGTFQVSFSGNMVAVGVPFDFTFRPGDRRLLLPGFPLSLTGFAHDFFGTDADACFPEGAPDFHDVMINSGNDVFIEYNEFDDVIRFVGNFSALAQNGETARDYILILEGDPTCLTDSEVNFLPESGTSCTGVFTRVNLRSHQKRLEKISPACVTGGTKDLASPVGYMASQD